MILDILFQVALYTPLILGIYLSFSILKITDLTADGSFVLGAVIYGRLITEKIPLLGAILMSLLGGASVGIVLSLMQRHNRIPPIVASILGVFMLYSVNLTIAGRPNINLLHCASVLDVFETEFGHVALVLIMLVLATLLACTLHTTFGLKTRAFGCNAPLLKRYGYNPEALRMVGLCTSNSLYALSGLLCAHMHKFADITMGMGVALVGIGAVTIGFVLYQRSGLKTNRFRAVPEVLFCLSGLALYFSIQTTLLHFNLNPAYLRFALGGLLTLTLITRTKEMS